MWVHQAKTSKERTGLSSIAFPQMLLIHKRSIIHAEESLIIWVEGRSVGVREWEHLA